MPPFDCCLGMAPLPANILDNVKKGAFIKLSGTFRLCVQYIRACSARHAFGPPVRLRCSRGCEECAKIPSHLFLKEVGCAAICACSSCRLSKRMPLRSLWTPVSAHSCCSVRFKQAQHAHYRLQAPILVPCLPPSHVHLHTSSHTLPWDHFGAHVHEIRRVSQR